MGKAERTRQHIIERAAPLFNKNGTSGTSVDDVLSSANVVKRSFYKYFESKEKLSGEVADFLLDSTLERTLRATESGTAKQKLFAYMESYKNAYGSSSEDAYPFEGGCPILNFGVEFDDSSSEVREKVATVILKTIARFASIISQGIDSGEFGPDFPAEKFSLKLFSLIEGGMMVSRVLKNNTQMYEIIGMLKSEIDSYVIDNR